MSEVFNIRHMAELFLNAVCDMVMISGEPEFVAPYVGISAQIDVMQKFMEGDMMDAMTGEEDITQAPELWEAQDLNAVDSETDMDDQIAVLSDDEDTRGIEPDIFNREELTALVERIKNDAISQKDDSRLGPLAVPIVLGIIEGISLLAQLGPPAAKMAKKAFKGITFAFKRSKNLKASAKRLYQGGKNLPKTLKNAGTRAELFAQITGGMSSVSTTAMMMSQQMGDTAAQVACSLQMVMQLQTTADYLRAFSPNAGQLYDNFVVLDDTVKQALLEENGNKVETTYPKLDEEYKSAEDALNEAIKNAPSLRSMSRGDGDTPTPPPTPKPTTAPVKPSVAIPNISSYTINDALRYVCRELSILEKEFKVFNSRMAMDKDEIPKFLAGKESTMFTKDVGLGEMLFRALNVPDRKETAGAVPGPVELKTLSEILFKAFPTIEVTDPITKKKQHISVFELIMQAQSAKVIELGPGFLKWYPDLEVLDNKQSFSESPKTGT